MSLVLPRDMKVLVLSYTNHALDQFLVGLFKIGISKQYMVRLGSKSTEETAELSLEKQLGGKRCQSAMDRAAAHRLEDEIRDLKADLDFDRPCPKRSPTCTYWRPQTAPAKDQQL